MIAFIRKLLKDRRGNALVIACAAMPLVVGCAGLATDTIQWTLWKRQLQRAADSAAIAGVYDREAGSGATTNTSNAVCRDLAINLHTWMSLTSTTPCTGTNGSYTNLSYPTDASGIALNEVHVELHIQQQLPFSSLFLSTAPTIIANATAASLPVGASACIQALETDPAYTGITGNGTTTVSAPNCVLYSNSPSTNSASAGGNSSLIAQAIAAVGGIAQSNNWNVKQYIPYSPPLADPFANVTPDPTAMHCVPQQLNDSTNFLTLPPGTNCFTDMRVGSNRTLNVPPNFGPIYLNGGGATLQGNFNCTGCSIVLTNSDPTSTTIGTLSTNAQASNNITAPTSGTFKGIAIYQDRRSSLQTDSVNGGSGSLITGALYFPGDILRINGNGTGTSLCAMFVARRINFIGTSGISLVGPNDPACSGTNNNQNPVRMVRLVA